jgi:hypothetical protein
MNRVLTKGIVAQFYKINTGFFLVLFLLLFGLLNGEATIDLHRFLMINITSDYRFLIGAMVLWLLYNIKCTLYVHNELRNPASAYLFTMQSLSNTRQFLLWFACHIKLLLPTIVYTCVTVSIGINNGNLFFAGLFLIFQLLLCVASALLYHNTINSTWKQLLPPPPRIMQGVKKQPYTFLLHYSLHMRKGTFIALKILSLLLLKGMIAANDVEINKESIAVLMMFLISAHSLMPVYFVQFAETRLAFIRNMPIRKYAIFLTATLTYAVIFLPEILFLYLNSNHALPTHIMLELYAVAISQLLMYTSLRYVPHLTTDKYTLAVLALFFGTLLFLASFNLLLLCGAELALSITLFLAFYDNFELQTGPL